MACFKSEEYVCIFSTTRIFSVNVEMKKKPLLVTLNRQALSQINVNHINNLFVKYRNNEIIACTNIISIGMCITISFSS